MKNTLWIFIITAFVIVIILLNRNKKRPFTYSENIVPTGNHTVIGGFIITDGADCGPNKMCCGASTPDWSKCPDGYYDTTGKWYNIPHGTHCGDIHKVETDWLGNSNAAECGADSKQCGCFPNTYF